MDRYLPPWAPGEFNAAVPTLAELETPVSPPGAAPAPAVAPGVPTAAELDAAGAARDAEQAALEARHGALGTAGRHFARGVLDAVLAPAALAGVMAEGYGYLAGWKGLEEFGRGLGESASGRAAMEAAAFAVGAATDAEQGLKDYERMRRDNQESQRAWPLLSSISNMAGMATLALATGGAAGAGASAATSLGTRVAAAGAVGALEGAGGGAQAAYAQSAPLRDVLSSTVVGALLGGGIGAGATGLAGAAAKGLSGVGGGVGSLDALANRKALQAFGAQGSDLKALVKEFGHERLQEMGKRLRTEVGVGGLMESLEGRAGRLGEATDEAGREIGEILERADKLGKPNFHRVLERMQAHADELKGGLGPDRRLAATIENDYLSPLVEQVQKRGSVTFDDLAKFRIKLDKAIRKVDHIEKKNLRPFRDVVSVAIDDAVEEVGGELAQQYRTARRAYQDLVRLRDIADERVGSLAGNRSVSLTDTISTVGGYVTGGPLGGIASGLANAAVRKYGDAAAVKLIDAMQRLGRRGVSVQRAGGREAKEAIDALAKLKDGVRKAVAGAGDNPEARWAAERAARDAAADELSKAAGTFRGWDRELSPVQKVLHRSEILDTASRELADDFARVGSLRPRELELDYDAVRRLTRDVAEPYREWAIADTMARVERLAREVPPTTAGAQLGFVVRHARGAIRDADVPGAMVAAHRALRELEKVGRGVRPTGDAAADELSALGLSRMKFLRDGMRDMTAARAAVKSGKVEPLLVEVFPGGNVTLGDGRHRLQAAIEQGVEELPVNVAWIGEDGAVVREWVGPLSVRGQADDLTRQYAARAASELGDLLGADRFGEAGRLYRQLRRSADEYEILGSAEQIRDALRTMTERGKLPGLVARHNAELEQALAAAKKLGGKVETTGIRRQLRALEERFAKAEEAATLDGGPIARVLDFFQGGLDGKMAASVAPGASLETVVGDTVRGKMESLLPALRPSKARYRPGATRAAAAVASRALTTAEQHDLYRERVKLLAEMQAADSSEVAAQAMLGMPPGTPDGLAAVIGADYQQKLANLARDIPRPKPDIRGKAFETLSSDQLRLANAMWEATTDPLSVFGDFRAGVVDYDKVQYAWQQYPGLQQAAQLALVDAFQEHLAESDRAAVPDNIVSQLDYLLGFEGRLQQTLAPDFCVRMDAVGAELARLQQQQDAQLALTLPGSKPTYTERVGGAIT